MYYRQTYFWRLRIPNGVARLRAKARFFLREICGLGGVGVRKVNRSLCNWIDLSPQLTLQKPLSPPAKSLEYPHLYARQT